MWLSTYRLMLVLVLARARAEEQRMAGRKHGSSEEDEPAGEGQSSAGSPGCGELLDSMLIDPDSDLLDTIEDSIL